MKRILWLFILLTTACLFGSCSGLVSSSGSSGPTYILPSPVRTHYFFQDNDIFNKNKDLKVFMNNPDGSLTLIPIDAVSVWVNGTAPDTNGICTFVEPGIGSVQVQYTSQSAAYDIIVWDAKQEDTPQSPVIPGGGGIIIIINGPY